MEKNLKDLLNDNDSAVAKVVTGEKLVQAGHPFIGGHLDKATAETNSWVFVAEGAGGEDVAFCEASQAELAAEWQTFKEDALYDGCGTSPAETHSRVPAKDERHVEQGIVSFVDMTFTRGGASWPVFRRTKPKPRAASPEKKAGQASKTAAWKKVKHAVAARAGFCDGISERWAFAWAQPAVVVGLFRKALKLFTPATKEERQLNGKDLGTMNAAILNSLSTQFASGYLDLSVGVPVSWKTYYFGLTFEVCPCYTHKMSPELCNEKRLHIPHKKLRVMLAEKAMIDDAKIFELEPTYERPTQKPRWDCMREMARMQVFT